MKNPQNWFHIKGLNLTIDLNKVSVIVWNDKMGAAKDAMFFTKVFLGTAIVDSETVGTMGNEWWIKSNDDRQTLCQTLFPDGCPIKLLLNEEKEETDAQKA